LAELELQYELEAKLASDPFEPCTAAGKAPFVSLSLLVAVAVIVVPDSVVATRGRLLN
jgi:hypothetical protein